MNGQRRCAGQSLIETSLSLLLVCLLFAGLIQVSQLFAAREVLHDAAVRGARAKTVGFDRTMVEKAVMVGAIPNAGRITSDDYVVDPNPGLLSRLQNSRAGEVWDYALRSQPDSNRHRWERNRIPDFLKAGDIEDGRSLLDYEDWDTIGSDHVAATTNAALLRVSVWQDYPLKMPAHRAFYAADFLRMEENSWIENHYENYMIDEGL